MAKINRADLTKIRIVQVATRKFLENGYSNTSVKSISDEVGMSTGNLTFYYPTKEHLLAVLTEILCNFQWQMVADTVSEGKTSLMAVCLELASMASICEDNDIVKDFYLATYSHPLTLDIIRRSDSQRAREVFATYCPDWTDEDFLAAETIVSGIEYATLMTTPNSAPLETRIREALDSILSVYRVPAETRALKIRKVLSLDYHQLGRQFLDAFINFAETSNEQAMDNVIRSWLGKN